jgi:hypothetical protein
MQYLKLLFNAAKTRHLNLSRWYYKQTLFRAVHSIEQQLFFYYVAARARARDVPQFFYDVSDRKE